MRRLALSQCARHRSRRYREAMLTSRSRFARPSGQNGIRIERTNEQPVDRVVGDGVTLKSTTEVDKGNCETLARLLADEEANWRQFAEKE